MSDATKEENNARHGQLRFVDSQAAWVTAQTMASTFNTATIDCRGYHQLEFTITVDSDSDPVGELYIQGAAVDVSARMISMPIGEGKVFTDTPASITHTDADLTKIVINDPAADATISFKLELPFSFMRLRYVRTGGGSATGFAAAYTLH